MTKIHNDEIVSLSVSKLVDNKLPAEMFFIGYLFMQHKRWLLHQYFQSLGKTTKDACTDMLAEEYLELLDPDGTITVENIKTSSKLDAILKNGSQGQNAEDWFDEWYDLWPTGIKSGGYYIKTDRRGSLRKMKSFMLAYPQYGKEDIFKATKNYLLDQSIRGWTHTKLIPYFIQKDGMSILAGECENLEQERRTDPEVRSSYGLNEI